MALARPIHLMAGELVLLDTWIVADIVTPEGGGHLEVHSIDG